MPQNPQTFDPNEFAAPAFNPNEFAGPVKSTKPPDKSTGYTSLWDTAASYVPQPVKSAWNTVWEPTTDITSRAGKAVSDYLDPTQYGNYDPRRYLAAYPEAIGGVLTGLTSPGNLALAAATGGAGAARGAIAQKALPVIAPKVAQGLTTAGRAIGGVTAAHGVQTIANPRTTLPEKAFGALEAVGGGLATRAPRPKTIPAAIPAAIPEELPIPARATPTDPNYARGMDDVELADSASYPRAADGPVVPGSQAAIDLADELDAAQAEGLTIVPANSPAANYASKQGYEAVRTLSDGSIAFNVKKSTPATPATDAGEFLESVKQGEAPRKVSLEMEGGPVELEFLDPKTGEVKLASQAKPGDIPLPVAPTSTTIPGSKSAPQSTDFMSWVGKLAKDESGEFDINAITGRFARGEETPNVKPSIEQVETPEVITPVKASVKTPAFERLGKIIGKERAQELTTGERTIKFSETPPRKVRGLLRGSVKTWSEWGDNEIKNAIPDPAKPGLSVEPHTTPSLFPRALSITYRDASGNPIGILHTDLQGTGISELAVSSKIGLRRGKVAFEMLKQAFDRGVSEPSGATSDLTRNLIDRVKKLAKGESGEFDADVVIDIINKMIRQISGSGIGQSVGKFMRSEGGEVDLDRLSALFRKQQRGILSPEELAEARVMAKEYQSTQQTKLPTPESASSVSPADDVAKSLEQRLRKAIDDSGTPNVVAAEDISALMDEAAQVLDQMPNGLAKQGITRQILGANKALLTSWDMSAPGRQGKAFILNKSWWTSLDDMARAWGSKTAADNINQSIIDHPSNYFTRPTSKAGKVGKSFADEVGLDLASTEEMFESVIQRAAGKIPLVKRSSRAHTAFLNKLRSDQFVSMMNASKKAGANPEQNIQLAKSYAKFINDATGRGSLNISKWKLERNVGVLNDVFFAPKNMSGQIRTWNGILNPFKYYNYDPVMRKQALRSLFAVAGTGLAIGEMAMLAGAKVSNDPTSSDFRKIRIGDTRIDLFGGYQQFPVAAMKFLSGRSTPTTGDNAGIPQDLTAGRMGQNRESIVERFFTNRLSPAGSFIWAWMSNREFDGKPFEVKRALYERIFPIAAKDLLDLAQEDPALAVMLGPFVLAGLAGTQTYTGR